jgi:DNA repair protein RecO (recombination protein O)
MANISAKGVIIKQTDYGEGHRMLSVFTEEYGIIKAVSYGVKKAKSKAAASSQFLCYGNFDFYKAVNRDVLTVNSIDTVDGFYPISEDIQKLSLCTYLADITYELLGSSNPDERLLHIFLNAIYALAYRDESLFKVKTVYELKLMAIGGYAPNMGCCTECGAENVYAFDTAKGGIVCRSCMTKNSIKISEGIYRAIRYITSCDDKKMLSFKANDDLLKALNTISEKYISTQIDCKFASLDYFKAILQA